MPEITFGKLNDDEFEAAIAIIVEATHWLLSKGIQQWLEPLPAEFIASGRTQAKIMRCIWQVNWQGWLRSCLIFRLTGAM